MTDATPTTPRTIELVHLLASPLHRYEGRPAEGALPAAGEELHDRIELREGLGIVGDRYFGHRAHVGAAVTLLAMETIDELAERFGLNPEQAARRARRNILTRGLDVDALRGATIRLDTGEGEVVLRATRPANPCAWMDAELAPGAFRALRGRGGMRCAVLSSGALHRGQATCTITP
ncbi:MOSC domain-containing protein [Microcella flavibacter]|uniref:MOSC domain-containing protein n=1 Tax=Microcella flavibacter TaxID=1804990 RepID=UPI001457059D|nr:MOSC domain-containing protein [Microcella flavibacter]